MKNSILPRSRFDVRCFIAPAAAALLSAALLLPAPARADYSFASFTVSQGTYADKIRLEWSATPGSTLTTNSWPYRVYRWEWGHGDNPTVRKHDETYFDDTDVEPGTLYGYFVSALDGNLNPNSGILYGWAGTLAVAENVSASQGTYTDKVHISWDVPAGAQGSPRYTVWRKAPDAGAATLVGITTDRSIDDREAEPGVRYQYYVKTYENMIDGVALHQSETVEGWCLPETPVATNLEATQGTLPDRVQLSWSGGAYAASFKVRRWRYQGYTDLVSGLTAEEYDDMTAEPGEEYRYQIFLTDIWGRTSESDFVTGWVGERPGNDDFENAWAISSKSGSSVSTNLLATGQAGEPFPSDWYIEAWRGIGATNTVWWSYTAPCAGIVRFTTDGSHDVHNGSIRTAMAVFTGNSLGSLQEVRRAYGDSHHDQSAGWCTNAFEVSSGAVFRIQTFSTLMDDGGPGRGTMCLNWSYTHYRVTFDPNGGTISTNAVMVPVGQKLGDAMASFPVPVREGYRFVDWKFENNASVSASAAFAITESHALHAEWASISSNDNFENALPLNAPGQTSGFSEMSNTNATLQAGEPLLSAYPNATNTLWWSWTAPANGTAHFSTTNSVDISENQIDTVIGVYTGSALGSLVQVATGDDGVKESGFIDEDVGTFWSFVDFEATEGTTYYVCVGVNEKYSGRPVEGMIRLYWSLETSGVSSGGYALLPPGSSGVDIPSALGGSADPSLEDIFGGDVDAYNDFAEWANEMGADDVRASTHSAASYQLGTTALLQNDPVITIDGMEVTKGVPIPTRRGSPSDVIFLTLTVSVTDGGEPVEVTAAKVAKLFEATTDLSDWDSAEKKLDPHAEAITDGSDTTVTIRVTPGDGTAPQAFLRIAP